MKSNIGWKYYKDYYRLGETGLRYPINNEGQIDITTQDKRHNTDFVKNQGNQWLVGAKVRDYKNEIQQMNTSLKCGSTTSLKNLAVQGRGFLTGAGISHEMGISEEYKMGITFDHTYGLPFISGSSLKGALRALFKNQEHHEYLKALIEEYDEQAKERKRPGIHLKNKGNFLGDLEKRLFTEKPAKGKRCVFIGACLAVEQADVNITLFRKDVLTPHGGNPTKKPIPLPFLTLQRNLRFNFYFEIYDMDQYFENGNEGLKNLFRLILREEGLGAKKNYDFGRFY